MLNLTTKSTYYFVDSYGMMLRQDLNGTGELGERDSIGRTFEAYWIYRNESFIDGLCRCDDPQGERIVTIFRHPSLLEPENYYIFKNDISRDHILYYTMAFRLYGSDCGQYFNWKISDTAHLDLSSYAYLRKKWWLYYLYNIPAFIIINLWNRLFEFVGGFEKEPSQEEFLSRQNNYK